MGGRLTARSLSFASPDVHIRLESKHDRLDLCPVTRLPVWLLPKYHLHCFQMDDEVRLERLVELCYVEDDCFECLPIHLLLTSSGRFSIGSAIPLSNSIDTRSTTTRELPSEAVCKTLLPIAAQTQTHLPVVYSVAHPFVTKILAFRAPTL